MCGSIRRESTATPQIAQATVALVSATGCSAQRSLRDGERSCGRFLPEPRLRLVLDVRKLFIQFFGQQIRFLRREQDRADSSAAADAAFPVYNVRFHRSRVFGQNGRTPC